MSAEAKAALFLLGQAVAARREGNNVAVTMWLVEAMNALEKAHRGTAPASRPAGRAGAGSATRDGAAPKDGEP